jgi:hypothetical protein
MSAFQFAFAAQQKQTKSSAKHRSTIYLPLGICAQLFPQTQEENMRAQHVEIKEASESLCESQFPPIPLQLQ